MHLTLQDCMAHTNKQVLRCRETIEVHKDKVTVNISARERTNSPV